MSRVSYDPEVWFFLRRIWQVSSKISFSELVELVRGYTNKPLPSSETVRKRSKAEKWEKDLASYRGKSDFSLEKTRGRFFEQLKKEYDKIQNDRSILPTELLGENEGKTAYSVPTNAVLEEIASTRRNIASVLEEHRARSCKIGKFMSASLDYALEVQERYLLEIKKDKPMSKAFERRFNEEMKMALKFSSLVGDMAESNKTHASTEFVLFGMNVDDTRDAVTGDRIEAMQASDFDEQVALLDAQAVEMHKQMAWIESGAFVEEVEAEMLEQQRQEELEAEYVEYTDIDEDEDE